jgi:hypothetical protein
MWIVALVRMNGSWIRGTWWKWSLKSMLRNHLSHVTSYAYTWNIDYWWSSETLHESILLLKFQANKWSFWGVGGGWMMKIADFDGLNAFHLLPSFTCFHRPGATALWSAPT